MEFDKNKNNSRHSVALIVLYDSEKRFLLQHRSKDANSCPNYWAFFGGGIEQHETPSAAVCREAYEEINLILEKPRLFCEIDFNNNNIFYHIYVYIEALTERKNNLQLKEGQGWGWFNEEEMQNMKMLDRDRKIIKDAIRYLNMQALNLTKN